MAKAFMLEILTPESVVVSEEVSRVITKTPSGFIEFLHGHEPMIVSLVTCITKFVDKNGEEKQIFTSKGIVNVKRDSVKICLDAAEFKEDIDFDRAKSAEKRAMDKLKEGSFESVDIIKASLERARIRMQFKQSK